MGLLAGYLRVSHVGGRDKDPDRFHSPEEQTTEIKTWAKAEGHRVELLEPELDRKGGDPTRPILREAVEGVKSGRFDGVVVAYLSRAGRDLRLMLDLWDEVEAPEVGGVVYFAREKIDGSTPSGRLQRNLLASIAQHELEERRDGFERATKGAVEAGIWQRRQTPRGYEKDPATRRLVVVEEQAEQVRAAARRLLAGDRIVLIAEDLRMTPGGVRAMLRNRVYLGELKVRSYVNPDAHPPILGQAAFAEVQAHLANAPRPGRNPSRRKALLAGLIRCTSCGHVMTRKTGKQKGYVYQCPTYHSGQRCPKPAGVTAVRIEGYVEAVALHELKRLSIAAQSGGMGLAEVRREVAGAKAERAAYLEAVDAAGIGTEAAAAGMRVRQEKIEAAEERERVVLARVPRLPLIQGAAEVWKDLNPAERNDLLRSLLAAVLVRPVGAGRRVDVAERVRVLRYGADLILPARNTGDGAGIVPLGWPDADGVDVIGVPIAEDSL